MMRAMRHSSLLCRLSRVKTLDLTCLGSPPLTSVPPALRPLLFRQSAYTLQFKRLGMAGRWRSMHRHTPRRVPER